MRRTRSPVPTLLAAGLLLLVGALPGPGAARAETAAAVRSDLARRLASRLRAAGLPAGRYGVAVIERGARPRVVFGEGHTRALIPASVAKVLTAATAIDLLGPAHTFTTSVTARGNLRSDGLLEGDLVVHGTGDPNLSGRFHAGKPLTVLAELAAAVRTAGVRRVQGTLVLDDGPFDRTFVHETWVRSDRARWYGAGVAGLAFNDGCADVVVRGAGQAGLSASVDVPSTLGVWHLENRVKTVGKGKPAVGGIWVKRESALRVSGTIAKGSQYRFSHPVPDPLVFFGGAFLRALQQVGVIVDGGMRPAADHADRRAGTLRIAQHGSGMSETLRVMNKRSQNFYASLLHKASGAALTGWGTWESGRQAVSTMLVRRGLDAQGKTRIVDGSGLSTSNLTTAATVARLLVSFEADLLRGPALLDSLAVPGEQGTLRRRLKRGDLAQRLHAKSGTLGRSGVHALAGYLDGRDGHPGYAFAIFLNTSKGGRSLIDQLVLEMAKR